MRKSSIVLKTGSRSSKLALIQAQDAINRLTLNFNILKFELTQYSSPGDRDKISDLEESPDDFFTKDLDDAVLNGELDCAIHSAKDMPYPVKDKLDWFWLPWHEDPRDTYILQKGKKLTDLPQNPVVGVSSKRRNLWSQKYFKKPQLKPIRGNIEERLEQLDNGHFDIIIMAAAALNRLNLQSRISGYISTEELYTPDGQGYLALTFRQNDKRFEAIRSLFIKSVTFTGAGCGRASLCTVEGINSLKDCDVCLYDALIDKNLLKHIPKTSKKIFVGKRSGDHSKSQNEICDLILQYSREGKKVVRLKGGDPAIFGRLKEEIEILNNHSISYNIIPGISALLGATGPAGIQLTERGVSRGFIVTTPSRENNEEYLKDLANLPIVFFMAVEKTLSIIEELIQKGYSEDTPASMIFNGATYTEEKIFATLGTLYNKIQPLEHEHSLGLLIVGSTAKNSFKYTGALSSKKILITGSDAIQEKAIKAVANYNGTPISFPLIELKDNGKILTALEKLENFNYIILSSPTVIKIFFNAIKKHNIDIRNVPPVIVSGKESEKLLNKYLIKPYAVAAGDDAGKSITNIFKSINSKNKILRIGSSMCGSGLSDNLSAMGFTVEEVHICDNRMVLYSSLPKFDAIIFSSGSAIESFITQFGRIELSGKILSILGVPSERVLDKHNLNSTTLISENHSIESQVFSLARYYVNQKLENDYE